eukprot:9500560-Pyramimonas_sp.AAC.1
MGEIVPAGGYGGSLVRGYALKVFALLFSSFREVLLLDADNNAARDPAFLFTDATYLREGGLFWHDYWGLRAEK